MSKQTIVCVIMAVVIIALVGMLVYMSMYPKKQECPKCPSCPPCDICPNMCPCASASLPDYPDYSAPSSDSQLKNMNGRYISHCGAWCVYDKDGADKSGGYTWDGDHKTWRRWNNGDGDAGKCEELNESGRFKLTVM
jgi:hypothetical protein